MPFSRTRENHDLDVRPPTEFEHMNEYLDSTEYIDWQDPHEADRARQRCENVREALACLSGTDRAILAFRYEEQFSTSEIADILRVPEGTVKSRLHHARRRLRDLLEQ